MIQEHFSVRALQTYDDPHSNYITITIPLRINNPQIAVSREMAASGNLESYVMGAIEDIIKKAIQDATYPVPQTALATNYSKALMEEYYGEDLKTFYSSKFLNRVVPGLEDAGSIGWKRDLLPAHSSHWKCSNCGAPDEDGEKCSYCQCSRVIQSEG